MKYLKKLYYKNISPNFFTPANKQTKFKIFKNIKHKIKPKDVLIITAYDDGYSKIGKLSEKSIKLYAKKFSFRSKILRIPSDFESHKAWYKIKLLIDLIKNKKNQIIVWIDSDAVFTRYVDLRNELDDYHEFYLVSHKIKVKNFSKYKNTELAISRINTGVMIFKFGAKWCGPCRKIKTHVEDYFSVLPKNVICFDLDIDECSDVYAFLKSKRQVNGVPALLAYKMGNTSFAADFSYSGSNLQALKVFFERVILESSRI